MSVLMACVVYVNENCEAILLVRVFIMNRHYMYKGVTREILKISVTLNIKAYLWLFKPHQKVKSGAIIYKE